MAVINTEEKAEVGNKTNCLPPTKCNTSEDRWKHGYWQRWQIQPTTEISSTFLINDCPRFQTEEDKNSLVANGRRYYQLNHAMNIDSSS